MTITAWRVYQFGDHPEPIEYARGTEHFYVTDQGRRDKKETSWYRTYATEAAALAAIAMRKDGEHKAKEKKQIEVAAHELLDALEHCIDCLGGEFALPADCVEQAREAIAKAKGEQP